MIKNENTRGGALAEESGALAGERRADGEGGTLAEASYALAVDERRPPSWEIRQSVPRICR